MLTQFAERAHRPEPLDTLRSGFRRMIEDAFVDVCERDLDFVLAEEFECSHVFRVWFLQRTGDRSNSSQLVRVRRSVSTQHGETDLLVVCRNAKGTRRALLIENKIAAPFTERQPERYRTRGNAGMKDKEWEEFATVLVAPDEYLKNLPEGKFDYQISYQDCEEALDGSCRHAEFKRRIFRAACEKAKQPWDKVVDSDLTQWFTEVRSYAAREFPDLPLRVVKGGRAPTSKWITFNVHGFGARVTGDIQPHNGKVSLRFSRVDPGSIGQKLGSLLPKGIVIEQARKSVSLQSLHSKADTDQPFIGQEDVLRPMLASAQCLLDFAIEHKGKIMGLLG